MVSKEREIWRNMEYVQKKNLFLKSNFFKLYYILMYTQMLSREDKINNNIIFCM